VYLTTKIIVVFLGALKTSLTIVNVHFPQINFFGSDSSQSFRAFQRFIEKNLGIPFSGASGDT